MKACAVAITLLLAFLANQVAAYTGNDLLRLCQGEVGTTDRSTCLGYIMGSATSSSRAMILYYHSSVGSDPQEAVQFEARSLGYCIPEGATVGQMADVTMAYMRDYPEQRHIEAAYVIIYAFREAFPCPSASPLLERVAFNRFHILRL